MKLLWPHNRGGFYFTQTLGALSSDSAPSPYRGFTQDLIVKLREAACPLFEPSGPWPPGKHLAWTPPATRSPTF
eukprot:601079-Amorphochlora_amoeboformis.AAC.1